MAGLVSKEHLLVCTLLKRFDGITRSKSDHRQSSPEPQIPFSTSRLGTVAPAAGRGGDTENIKYFDKGPSHVL